MFIYLIIWKNHLTEFKNQQKFLRNFHNFANKKFDVVNKLIKLTSLCNISNSQIRMLQITINLINLLTITNLYI